MPRLQQQQQQQQRQQQQQQWQQPHHLAASTAHRARAGQGRASKDGMNRWCGVVWCQALPANMCRMRSRKCAVCWLALHQMHTPLSQPLQLLHHGRHRDSPCRACGASPAGDPAGSVLSTACLSPCRVPMLHCLLLMMLTLVLLSLAL
jgi:hypothetical protein